MNFPVVAKIISDKVIHKSDSGAVITNIKNKDELKKIFQDLNKKFKKKEGVLIQEQISGIEIIIGSKYDPCFGPTILFGLGGIYTAILKDVSLRIAPIDKKQAEEMIYEIKTHKILEGARGQKAVAINKLVDILVKTSNLVTKFPVEELDFNPVIANDKKALVVDVRIFKRQK
jgi:acyl-CoA synthetase (NDP forming)